MEQIKKIESRGKKAVINIVTDLSLQFVTIICGFILPKLILSNFGSTYNGIIHSITQFIGCVELLKSGIGSVTRSALYIPLAKKSSEEISKVVFTTEKFLRKIAIIFLAAIFLFSIVYPFIIHEQLPFVSITLLVLILSISTFAQYFWGLAYQMVLQADQKNYVISITQILIIVINTLLSALLIKIGCSIHIVKLGSAIVFAIPPIVYMIYCQKKYKLKKNVELKRDLISQRWDAFGHQVANFINLNTDVMVITIFLKLAEVSVYSVHNMITYSLKKIITSISSSVTGAFGNMYAKKEEKNLKKNFKQFELVMFLVSTTIYSTASILLTPFIKVYTEGINDANYNRPLVSIFMCIACYFSCVKLPYETIVYVAGKFKETKKAAYIEAAINIVLSCILVNIYGIVGILIGTSVAGIYRLLFYNDYVSKNIISYEKKEVYWSILYTIFSVIISYFACKLINIEVYSYLSWFAYATIIFIINTVIALLMAYLMFKETLINIFIRLKTMIRRRK